MTEPTLAQWRERALVAEALLEERTQEAEGLRAELEDLKAKQSEAKGTPTGRMPAAWSGWDKGVEAFKGAGRSMSGTKIEEYARGMYDLAKADPGRADKFAAELTSTMTSDDLMLLIEIMAALERKGTPPRGSSGLPKAKKKVPWPPEDKFSRNKLNEQYYDEYAPQLPITDVWAKRLPESGDVRVGWRWDGAEKIYQITNRDYYEQSRGGTQCDRVAAMLAETVAVQLGMDRRSQDTLATLLAPKLQALR